MLVSSLPGRLRVRHDLFTDHNLSLDIHKQVASINGVHSASINTSTGSMLVVYDTKVLALQEAENSILGILPVKTSAKSPKNWNRGKLAKRGMLACLGISLTMAALDEEDIHILFGLGFIGFLGLHLNIHKKRIFK